MVNQQCRLFSPLRIKSIDFKNRIWVSPMCQYSSHDGYANDWHLVHLGSRAVGGAGMVMMEATSVTPEGRISFMDNGIWSDDHIVALKPISDFIKKQGAASGIQIAHAGRKGSTPPPKRYDIPINDASVEWETIAPSSIAFKQEMPAPREMSIEDINHTIDAFKAAAERCLKAGFEVLELHMAHGYLMHQFLSPLSNQRQDHYGGSFENRIRFPLAVAKAVRQIWPDELPLLVRISATDWAFGPREGKVLDEVCITEHHSWTLREAIAFSQQLKKIGVDLIDCSSGGTLPNADMPFEPGYQVFFSSTIRKECEILTAAVGLITSSAQAETILLHEQADVIFLGRELLRQPYWPIETARYFNVFSPHAEQYNRAYE